MAELHERRRAPIGSRAQPTLSDRSGSSRTAAGAGLCQRFGRTRSSRTAPDPKDRRMKRSRLAQVTSGEIRARRSNGALRRESSPRILQTRRPTCGSDTSCSNRTLPRGDAATSDRPSPRICRQPTHTSAWRPARPRQRQFDSPPWNAARRRTHRTRQPGRHGESGHGALRRRPSRRCTSCRFSAR